MVSSPVLVTVVTTKFSNPSTLTAKLGVAEALTTEAAKVMKEVQREGENIVVNTVKAAPGKTTPSKSRDRMGLV